MSETDENQRLREQIERQAKRMKRAEQDRPTLLAHTVFIGTLGLLFVLPVVIGAYLGLWLDEHFSGYSIHWTVTMILLGVFVGAVNVYLFIRDR